METRKFALDSGVEPIGGRLSISIVGEVRRAEIGEILNSCLLLRMSDFNLIIISVYLILFIAMAMVGARRSMN